MRSAASPWLEGAIPLLACLHAAGCNSLLQSDGASFEQPPAYLKGEPLGAHAELGLPVRLEGGRLFAVASNAAVVKADRARSEAGAVFVYSHDATGWQQQARLSASHADAGDGGAFALKGVLPAVPGTQLAAAGDLVAVGFGGEDGATADPADNSLQDSGAVVVFTWTGERWLETDYIKPDTPASGAGFGLHLALLDGLLAVGEPFRDLAATPRAGSVVVFEEGAGGWVQRERVSPPNPSVDGAFGVVTALHDHPQGRLLLVSELLLPPRTGQVHVYRERADRFVLEATLRPPPQDIALAFGAALAVGSEVLVGAPAALNAGAGSVSASGPGLGAVYVFGHTDQQWQLQAVLRPPHPLAEGFGASLAVDGRLAAVGASVEDAGARGLQGDAIRDAGAAYLFEHTPAGWQERLHVEAVNPSPDALFGAAVALEADWLAVGAPRDDPSPQARPSAGELNSGAVYLYPVGDSHRTR